MSLDDADTIRRFLSQIKGQPERSNSTSPLSTQYGQVAHGHGPSLDADGKHVDQHNTSEGAKTPPHATLASQDHDYSKSPEAHPKPSPHISGLKAPQNTPKTAASSPRLQAGNTHNEDVAEAFSDYVNSMQGRPLSESMWATGSARYKPSMLSGARSATIFTPIKAVEPNSTINDTFDRMSFKAAESDGKADENLVGDRVTQSLYSKAPPSSANKFSILADTIYRDTVDDVQAKREAASDGGSGSSAQIDTVKKENDALSTSKEYVPPHLRATRSSSPKSDSSTRVPGVESTVTTAGSKPLKRESENEDLKHKTFFDAWPKLEERSKPAAKIRTVTIKDLPRGSTAAFVSSLVYGGSIEEIHIRSSTAGDLSAVIRFMNAEDCTRFYDETSNGLVYGKDSKGRELCVFVELSKDVDVVGGLLHGWMASGVTRCVRAVGVEADWDMNGLLKIAERKNRKVEKIVDGQNAGGARSVVFRFCRVEDAVQFKAALSRDEEWEHCNIHYVADPCAAAVGVHFES